jgi:hypothetical protein
LGATSAVFDLSREGGGGGGCRASRNSSSDEHGNEYLHAVF